MVDNFDFTEGSGKTGAADDVSNVLYPRVKLDIGTDGVGTPCLGGAGAVAAGVQRITLASDDPAVALLGTIDTDTGIIAGAVSATHMQCDIVAGTVTTVSTVTNLAQMGGAALAMDEGALGVGVQRVTLATDDDAVAHLATIAGDTTSLDGKIIVGGGAEAGAVLVTIANDSTGLVTVDTTGTSGLEVVQSVAGDLNCTEASASAIKDAVEKIDDWDESDRCKVNPIVGQAGVQGAEGGITALTQRVTIATDDDSVAHLATIAGDTTAIESAVEIMDDWDATHASAASADGPQIMGAGYSTGLPTDVGADGDAARICTDRFGRILRGIMPQWFNAIYDSSDARAEGQTIKAGTGSRKIYIMSYTISTDVEQWVKLQDEDGNALIGKLWLKAGGGATKTYPPEAPLVLDVVNKDLEVISEAAGDISVEITGYLAI